MQNKTTKPEFNKSTNKSLKTIIILLAFTMLGSLFYIYKVSDRSKDMIISLREQKMGIMNDLEKSKLFLDQVMTTNKSLSKKLNLEQIKVKKLIAELKNKTVTEKTVVVYKQSANNIDNRIKLLLDEINVYKNKIDSTNVVLKKERIINDTLNNSVKNLSVSNKDLTKKVSAASKLYFYDLKTTTLKVKGSGKQIETDKASKVDLIKISFMIAENELIKATSKEFYIQVIDSKNNIVGSKKVQNFDNGILNYSTSFKLQYSNKTIKGETEIPVSNLEKGLLNINVFDKSKLVLKTTLTLD